MNQKRIVYVLIVLVAVVFTMLFHEFGHYLTGSLLGNTMKMNLNWVTPEGGSYAECWHKPLVYAAGPIFTLVQAFLFLGGLRISQNTLFYPFVLFPAVHRIWPYIVSPASYQDEVKLASHLDWPAWIVVGFLWLVLLAIGWSATRKIKKSRSFVLLTIVLSLLCFLLLIGFNNLLFL